LNLSILLLPLEHLLACDCLCEPCLLLKQTIHLVVLLLDFLLKEDIMKAICLLLPLLLEGLPPIDTLHTGQVVLVLVQPGRKHCL
jgi:hypothetical protein